MATIQGARVKQLMAHHQLSTNGLRERLLLAHHSVSLARPTLSRIINDSYEGEPSALIVRGLAEVLETSTDYLLGLSSEPQPNAAAFASQYALADDEQLLAWLAQQNIELAEIMRAIRSIPPEEQQVILDHLNRDIIFVRQMVAARAESFDDE